MQDGSIGYIVDFYSPYNKNKNVIKTFKLRGQTLCIRAITSFEWGQPVFPEKNIEDNYSLFQIYNTVEEAEEYINQIRRINRGGF